MNVGRWDGDVPSVNKDTFALNEASAATHRNIHLTNPTLSMYSKYLIIPVKVHFTFIL